MTASLSPENLGEVRNLELASQTACPAPKGDPIGGPDGASRVEAAPASRYSTVVEVTFTG
jgi:hypothetical protein